MLFVITEFTPALENKSQPISQNNEKGLTKTGNEPQSTTQEKQDTSKQFEQYNTSFKETKAAPYQKEAGSKTTYAEEQSENNFWARLWEDPTAIVTMALVLVTLLLACCVLWQAWLFRRELILMQRPKLHVRNIVITNPKSADSIPKQLFAINEPVGGQLSIVNVGNTPAKITNIGCWVEWMEGELPMERPYEGENPNYPISIQLKAGQSFTLKFLDDRRLMGKEGDLIRIGYHPHALYVMGYIEYVDDIGTPRRTTFCRQYREGLPEGRFVTVDDPDYEYEE